MALTALGRKLQEKNMNISFENGRIVTTGILCDEVPYDVSNNSISVQFNGNSGINSYLKINDKKFFDGLHVFRFFVNGEEISFNTKKRVESIGRTQTVTYYTSLADIKTVSVLNEKVNAIITKIEVTAKEKISFDLGISMMHALSEKLTVLEDGSFFAPDRHCYFASDVDFVGVPENQSAYWHVDAFEGVVSGNIAYGYKIDGIADIVKNADKYIEGAFAEINDIALPSSVKTEEDKAIYYSSYFCALENYKELGDFKAFMAGCRYIFPARTYFRDSYFTVLCMYNGHTEKVRNEIVALSHAIGEDGDCPSAVIYDYSSHWGNHFDSPSMYVIMVYDYVNNTKDFSILSEKIGNYTVLELMRRVLKRLSEYCDETGLLVKKGPYNRRDWADEVNRYGYVTYDEILYARALYCFSKTLKVENDSEADEYLDRYEAVKTSINKYLWSEDKGYYFNFTDGDYTEDNLSIDTVLSVIYGIADERQSVRLLESCERILDSRNNPDVEPFGMFCVYPLYKSLRGAINKSATPFNYHNGADWPYWSAMLAYAYKMYGFEYEFALKNWFFYNLEKGNYTPVEYFSPYCKDGSLLQAWSSAAAFVYNDTDMSFFKNKV